MSDHTHYEVLGLAESASLDDIKKRYRDLVRRFHPDVPRTGNETRFKAIQEAYDVLADITRRTEYDADLKLSRVSASARGTATAGAGARPAGAANGAGPRPSPPGPGAAAANGAGAPPRPSAGMPGDVIAGKYRIVREIARSNDVVYEATDVAMGRRVAVKELVIPPNLTGQALRERIERFNREARAAGKLAHPNIVTVYDYGQDQGRYFIAMEYLEGGTLRDAMQQRGALPASDAVEIASQVLFALTHAHAHSVVHRDIKPDNIHLLPGGQVKLTDFGIARLTEEASLTGDGQIFGTPSYMSPEQIKGQFLDHRSDLFSLGIVLYEMLAGRKPFTGDSVISITYSIMENQPPPLDGVSYGIEQVVFRALAKDPRQRFGTADEMRRELKNAESVVPPLFAQPAGAAGMGGMGYAGGLAGGVSAGMTGAYAGGYSGGPGAGSIGSFPYGGSVPPIASPGAGASTVYAPPPMNAAPAQIALPGQAGQPGGGPFVNWNPNSANLPPGYAPPPPPFPARPAEPLFSEATKTFFKVLALAVLLGCVLLGGVLLFQRAFDEQRRTGQEMALNQLNADGKRLYESGDMQGALAKYSETMKRGPKTKAGADARQSIVVIYNNMGLKAFQAGDNRTAENDWFAAYNLDPNNSDVNYNLGKLYDRIGEKDQALQDWRQGGGSGAGASGRVTSADPSAPADDSFMHQQFADAQANYNAGVEAFKRGDVDAARAYWTKAAGRPGTEWSDKARQALNQTSTGLDNGPDF